MLRIFFGSLDNEIYNTDVYYRNQYDKSWITDDFARRIISDIDDSEVIGEDIIKNDIFNTFSSKELSAGVKTLLLIHNQPKKIFNISNCGDNCAKYLLEMAENLDITVCLHHVMNFGNNFAVRVINDGRRKIITDPLEFLLLAYHYLRGETNER
ncbi:MAG: DUF4869 domain-containing protein [Ruminococcus sp.]|nr:DUF4869 domain-containing protein [Ruminococcus sp.]